MAFEPDVLSERIEREAQSLTLDQELFLLCLCMIGKQFGWIADELGTMNNHLEQMATEMGGLAEPIANHSVTVHKA